MRSRGYGGGRASEHYMTGSGSLSEIVLILVKTGGFSLHHNAMLGKRTSHRQLRWQIGGHGDKALDDFIIGT